ncbi:MAG: hypothetical protein J6R42_02945 [Clostridia bacterium]|nr:hypothetical protein [Clostridia bacterium]
MRHHKAFIFTLIGYIFSILPPVLVAIEHFPLWIKAGEKSTCSALGVMVLLLCLIPLKRGISQALRSPAAWQMWLILFLVLYFTQYIAQGLMAVALVAFPFSVLGAIMFRLAKKCKEEERP